MHRCLLWDFIICCVESKLGYYLVTSLPLFPLRMTGSEAVMLSIRETLLAASWCNQVYLTPVIIQLRPMIQYKKSRYLLSWSSSLRDSSWYYWKEIPSWFLFSSIDRLFFFFFGLFCPSCVCFIHSFIQHIRQQPTNWPTDQHPTLQNTQLTGNRSWVTIDDSFNPSIHPSIQ